MKRIVWLSDVHLNFLRDDAVAAFLESVGTIEPDAVLLGGDIGEAPDVGHYLSLVSQFTAAPIYFVLGNHDYYHGSIAEVRQSVIELCRKQPQLHYLTVAGAGQLTPHVAVLGHDGWADGRAGNYAASDVQMQDYRLIRELAGLTRHERASVLARLGDEAAEHIRWWLPRALEHSRDALLLTHVPPLRAAAWHQGAASDDNWAPHFTCVAMGEAILDIMRALPDKRLTVLCGHTHSSGTVQPLPNVQVFTAAAEYGQPRIERVLEFD